MVIAFGLQFARDQRPTPGRAFPVDRLDVHPAHEIAQLVEFGPFTDGAVFLDAIQGGHDRCGDLARLHGADVGHDPDLQRQGQARRELEQPQARGPDQPQPRQGPHPAPDRTAGDGRPALIKAHHFRAGQAFGPVEPGLQPVRSRGDDQVKRDGFADEHLGRGGQGHRLAPGQRQRDIGQRQRGQQHPGRQRQIARSIAHKPRAKRGQHSDARRLDQSGGGTDQRGASIWLRMFSRT